VNPGRYADGGPFLISGHEPYFYSHFLVAYSQYSARRFFTVVLAAFFLATGPPKNAGIYLRVSSWTDRQFPVDTKVEPVLVSLKQRPDHGVEGSSSWNSRTRF
jgi:hypothetical protein